jgi:hypothetical protein
MRNVGGIGAFMGLLLLVLRINVMRGRGSIKRG